MAQGLDVDVSQAHDALPADNTRPDSPVSSDAAHGVELVASGPIGAGACIDVTVADGRLFAIGAGALRVFDISEPLHPVLLGSLDGLGNVRQIEVAGTVACITAREDGLYIVDVGTPSRPRLLYHYDTLEKATGVAVAPPLVAVADRFHGVELVDVSTPDAPVYLATCLAGKEVQSIDIRDGWLYAGAWADRELVVVDIRNPRQPRLAAAKPLDGYGDGVRVRDGYCYAATGHHAPAFTKVHHLAPDPSDRGHGEGHGVEVFDVREPTEPKLVARVKFPPFYAGYPDMWGAEIAGSHLAVTDVYNGMFLFDVSDRASPAPLGRSMLPAVTVPSFVAAGKKSDAVAGVAFGNGCLYLAGYFSGLYVVPQPDVRIVPEPSDTPVTVPPCRTPAITTDGAYTVFRPGGQVHAAIPVSREVAAVAAGNAGIHLVRFKPKVERISSVLTEGFALDVACHDGRLYVAEGRGGLSIWTHDGETLTFVGRYRPPNGSVMQVVVPAPGRYALIENGPHLFEIVDVSMPACPRLVLSERGPGLFYGKCITTDLIDARYASVYWHMGGPVWYDLAATPPARVTEFKAVSGNIVVGMAVHENRLVVLHANGYSVTTPSESTSLKNLPLHRLPDGESLNGIPAIHQGVLFACAGAWKTYRAVDIRDIDLPRLIRKTRTSGNPDRVAALGDTILIPDGHGGLRIGPLPCR